MPVEHARKVLTEFNLAKHVDVQLDVAAAVGGEGEEAVACVSVAGCMRLVATAHLRIHPQKYLHKAIKAAVRQFAEA